MQQMMLYLDILTDHAQAPVRWIATSHHFRQPAAHERLLGFWVNAAGRMHHRAGERAAEGRTLASHSVVLIEDGTGEVELGGRPLQRVRAGHLLWLYPHQPHSYRGRPAWRESWLYFDGPRVSEVLGHNGFATPPGVDAFAPDVELYRCFHRAWSAFNAGGPLAVNDATAALVQILGRARALRRGELSAAQRTPAVIDAMRLLDEQGSEALGPRQVARRLGIAYHTLRERFRIETGSSLQSYATAQRLAQARRLLAMSETTIAEVARACGYGDPAYFTRVFAREQGMPPSQWRRQHRYHLCD